MMTMNTLEKEYSYYENRSLIFDLLVQEMSKSLSETNDKVFKRIAKMVDFNSTIMIKKGWEELKDAVPEIVDNYTYLTAREKENLLKKALFEEFEPVLEPKDALAVCRSISNIYYETKEADLIFEKVAIKLNNGLSKEDIRYQWENDIQYNYMELPITVIELARLDKFKNAYNKYELKQDEKVEDEIINENIIENNITEEEIIDMLPYENTIEIEEVKPEELIEVVSSDNDLADCVFKQVGEDQFIIIKGTITLSKDEVLRHMNKQKTTVLGTDDSVIAKNFF